MNKIFDEELISKTNSIIIWGEEQAQKNILVEELIEFLDRKYLKISSCNFRGKLRVKTADKKIYSRDFIECQEEINSLDDRLIIILENPRNLQSFAGFNFFIEKILNDRQKMVVMLGEWSYSKHCAISNLSIACEYYQKIFYYISVNLGDIRKSNWHNFIRSQVVQINDYSLYFEVKLIKQVRDNSACPNLLGLLVDKILKLFFQVTNFWDWINMSVSLKLQLEKKREIK